MTAPSSGGALRTDASPQPPSPSEQHVLGSGNVSDALSHVAKGAPGHSAHSVACVGPARQHTFGCAKPVSHAATEFDPLAVERVERSTGCVAGHPTIVGEIAPPSAALSTPDELASSGETLASGFSLLEPLSALLEVVETTLPLQLGTKANAPQETATARVRTAAFIGAVFIWAKQPNRSTVSRRGDGDALYPAPRARRGLRRKRRTQRAKEEDVSVSNTRFEPYQADHVVT